MTRVVFFGGIGRNDEFGGEASKNKEIIQALRANGYNVVEIDTLHSSSRPAKLVRAILKLLWEWIMHSNATFIFSTSLGNVYTLFKLLSHLGKRRVAYWGIGGWFADRIAQGEFNATLLSQFLTTTIVEGEKMKQTLLANGFKNENVIVCPNFKSISSPPINKPNHISTTKFYFLSRIIPDKGTRIIFDAMNLIGRDLDYEVDFYGPVEDDYREEFHKSISQHPKATYKGSIRLMTPQDYTPLQSYHYMLFPSYWRGEGMPGAVVDAMIAGTPVIASDYNLNREFVIDGQNGIIVQTHSAQSLASAMTKAILDRQMHTRMASNCAAFASKWNTANVLTSGLLQQIVNP